MWDACYSELGVFMSCHSGEGVNNNNDDDDHDSRNDNNHGLRPPEAAVKI